jgi:hypothetical protein
MRIEVVGGIAVLIALMAIPTALAWMISGQIGYRHGQENPPWVLALAPDVQSANISGCYFSNQGLGTVSGMDCVITIRRSLDSK